MAPERSARRQRWLRGGSADWFSMDEYVAGFQARVFASGTLTAPPLADAWRPVGKALTPIYVGYDQERFQWLSMYLPVYSALRAGALRLGADRLLNPALAAASVVLVYACARRLWPQDKSRAWTAALFLALSSQVLFMSMTSYAMSAHLCLNLLWLYAYLREDRAGWLAAPFIGVAAMGLHNAVPHALFVTPFLVHLLLRRRWGWTFYFAAVYLAGAALWLWWLQSIVARISDSTVSAQFAMPGWFALTVQTLSLSVVLSWQTPLLAVILVWTAITWRELDLFERYLAASVVLSFGLFFFFPKTQGHGWGYRYTYPVLGNMVLLGAAGVTRLAQSLGAPTQRLLAATALITVFVQWPVRAWQIERFVGPFARAHDYVSRIDADVVIVDPTTSYYGIDLIRNDPFMRHRPKVLSAYWLRPQEKRALATQFGDRVRLLEAREIGAFGIPTFRSGFRDPVWPPQEPVATEP
jgi:hypothetical protein